MYLELKMTNRRNQLEDVNQTFEASEKSLKLHHSSDIDQQRSHYGIPPSKRSKESQNSNYESKNTSEVLNPSLKRRNSSEVDEHNDGINAFKRSKGSQSLKQESTSSDGCSSKCFDDSGDSDVEHNAGIQPSKRSKKSQSPSPEPTNSPEPQLEADEDQISSDEVRPVISPMDYLFSYTLLFLFGNMDLNSQPEH